MPAPKLTPSDRRIFTTLWDNLPVEQGLVTPEQIQRIHVLQIEYQLYLEEALLGQASSKTIRDIYVRLEKLNSAERYYTRAMTQQHGAWLPPIPEDKELEEEPIQLNPISPVNQWVPDQHTGSVHYCPICTLPIVNDQVSASFILSPCNHSTHVECALQLTRFNPEAGCPECNQQVTSVNVLYKGNGKELREAQEFFDQMM